MSLFSLFFTPSAASKYRKRCPIKGLSAKSRVIYHDSPRAGKVAVWLLKQPDRYLQCNTT
jgi:hypothetical protein